MTRRSVLIGTGSALPKRAVSNAEMAQMVDTSDEWIVERTGIRNRHIAGEGETTSTLATAAAWAALDAAGVAGESIELIILATCTPDQTFPASATIVQEQIGANGCIAFDVAAVCSGFLYAVGVADSMLRAGMASRALVIGAETMSRILDWEDRTTCVLFGDGAGAVVLEARDVAEDGPGLLIHPVGVEHHDVLDAERILRGDGGDDRQRVAADAGKGQDVGLQAGPAAGVGGGKGEDGGWHQGHNGQSVVFRVHAMHGRRAGGCPALASCHLQDVLFYPRLPVRRPTLLQVAGRSGRQEILGNNDPLKLTGVMA